MDYAGNKFGQSVKVSMLSDKMIVAEVDDKLIPKFKTEEDEKTHVETLEHWETELHEQNKDNHIKSSSLTRKDLSSVHIMLHSLCHISLRNRIEREVDYHDMVNTCKCDVMKLCILMKKTCNGSTTVLVDDMLGNVVDTLRSYR